MPTIGVIGVGRMGLPVCTRLAEGGFVVVATDRAKPRRAEIEAIGAAWVDSARAVADASEVLVTVLPGSPEVEEVMGALLPTLGREIAWIDLGSTSPQAGARLRALAADRHCLDAPMGGGPDIARAGGLELFVGGAPAAVERHRAVLEPLGRVHHVGGPGAGQVVKLLVNLVWFTQALATGEAMLLARRAGLDLPTVRLVLSSSAADSAFVRKGLGSLLEGDYIADFGLDRCYEELDAITELARELDVPFELSTLVRDIHARALERYGPRDGELLAVAMLEEESGIILRNRD
jgi:3-hydroxyisobutyrate dehydrogenase